MADVELVQLGKTYPDGTVAVRELDLAVADGEFMVLVGPSGCGKTTALRMVAGLEEPTDGEIRIGGQSVGRQPPKDRDIAMVFQSYALYPHLTVAANIGFGLALRKVPKAEVRSRVTETAKLLGLDGLLDKKPRHLSGGQRQRVAMGRAIVRRPRAFLMDEPLSNLDAKLRVQMRAEIAALQRDLGVTTVYVTHDQVEAMTMGHRVAVMRNGVLQQVDRPQSLYERPVNLFVAGFVGSPAMNLLEATVEHAGDGAIGLRLGSQSLAIACEEVDRRPALRELVGRTVAVGIRPEDMEDAAVMASVAEGTTLHSTARLVEALGKEKLVHFSIDAPAVLTEDARDLVAEAGPAAAADLVAAVSARSSVADGDAISLAVDTTRLHLFDLENGTRLADKEE